ncbi:uncharacterized protein METZ01_LOCUS511614, partial [marine metagenome]
MQGQRTLGIDDLGYGRVMKSQILAYLHEGIAMFKVGSPNQFIALLAGFII